MSLRGFWGFFPRLFRWVKSFMTGKQPPDESMKSYCDLLLAELTTLEPDTSYKTAEPLTWAGVHSLHGHIIRRYKLPRLKRALWDIRDRYQDAFGSAAFADYMKTQTSDKGSESKEEDIIADLDQLLGRLYARYSLSEFALARREGIVNRLFIVIMAAVFVLVVCFGVAYWRGSLGGSTIAAVIFAGTIGGFVSFIQRLQAIPEGTDQLNSILAFQTTRYTHLYTSPLAGAVFAVVLYFALLGQLISGAVFPKWHPQEKPPTTGAQIVADDAGTDENLTVLRILSEAHPEGPPDYALLFVWCFLAGFLERWVPDHLTRIANRAQNTDVKPA